MEALVKIAQLGECPLDLLITGRTVQAAQGANAPPSHEITAMVQAGTLKLSSTEEEVIYKLREMSQEYQVKALEGVHMVWVMAHRKKESGQNNE